MAVSGSETCSFAVYFLPLCQNYSDMTKKKTLPVLEGVTIEKVAAEGKCLFHYNEKVVFVPFCVPGDIADIQITRKKHSFCEGRVIRFVQYSAVREKPFCTHFGICGGCKWQNLPYAEQLKAKQQQVLDQLTKIGKIELPEFRPILGSEKLKEYRNKLEFGCANRRWYTKEELDQLPPKDSSAEDISATGQKPLPSTGQLYRFPHYRCFRQDLSDREMLAHGRPAQPDTQ
jgi:23S rRNA (uracil1939-C5)-methyltransferase